MFGCADQIEILPLDLVHHGIHFVKTHNTGHNVRPDHKWRNTVSKSTVNHEISCIGDYCRMNSCDVSHQIIETVSCNFSCSIEINSIKTFHNICMIWNLEIRNNRLAKLLDFYVAAIVFSDRYGWINDVWNSHHDLGDFLGKLLLLCLKLSQTSCILGYFCLYFLCFFLLPLCHQCTNLLGNLVFIGTKLICFCLCGTRLCVQFNHFINKWKLVILEFLLNVLFYHFRVLS